MVMLADDRTFTILAVTDAFLTASMTTREQIIGRGSLPLFPQPQTITAPSGVSDYVRH